MKPEFSSWDDLRIQAASSLPTDLGGRVLSGVATTRRKRRELLAAALTVLIGLFISGGTESMLVYRQQQQNLTRWNELVAITQSVDRGL